MSKIKVAMAALLCLLLSAPVAAQSFRVRSMTVIPINSQSAEARALDLGYNDAISLEFLSDDLFLRGVEIEIKIPQDLLPFRDTMAYAMYSSPRPTPTARTIDYQGEQLTMQTLPSRLSFVMQIPLRRVHNLRTGPYATVMPFTHEITRGPLLFRLLPVMKGLPENIETMVFQIRIRPILSEEGALRLSLRHPQDTVRPVEIRIDEVLQGNTSLILLPPGTHHLSITSTEYRNEVRMFKIEPARITSLEVQMQGTEPRLFLVAPENVQIFLDNVPVIAEREGLVLETGEHLIKFQIGDYELIRQINAEKGKHYTVSMLVDIEVQESP